VLRTAIIPAKLGTAYCNWPCQFGRTNGGHAAAGGIARAPHGGRGIEQTRHQVGERRGIRGDIGDDVQLTARQQDGDAVVANRPGDQHGIARLHVDCVQAHRALQDAHTGCVDKTPVGLATLHHFGIASGYDHASAGRGCGHRLDDAVQISHRKALFEDKPCREIQRSGARDGQVVDRPVDRQVANVSPWEKQWRYNKRVAGEGQAHAFDAAHRLILQRCQQWVMKRLQEQCLNQRLRGLAAGAVRHGDVLVPQPGLAPPHPLDAL
jgi:hypothetical protein